jgi:hypothetical protein
MSIQEEIITQFVLSSNTFKIHQMLPTPLYMNSQNYNYYLKLLQIQFSNVVPNVEQPLYVQNGVNSPQLVVDIGVYTLETLISKYNALSLGKLSYDDNTGKLTLNNDTGNTLNLVSSFLTSNICGFSAAQIINIANGASVLAQKVVVIQDYNYFMLSSPNFQGNTYVSKSLNSDNLKITNCLYAFSSAIAPFQFKTWTAIMPMLFSIQQDNLQYIDFEIRDGLDREIKTLMGPSDFSVSCQIVRCRKI